MGTSVTFTTNLGSFVVTLLDDAAPQSVADFLSYVTDLSAGYNAENSFFHRLASGFVLQGGGYGVQGGKVITIPTHAPVVNEYSAAHPNVAGTVAFAKVGGDPNSATDQFFINLADNSSNLDNQNGGFTVFGVVSTGFDVVLKIAQLPVVAEPSPLDSLPVEHGVTAQTAMVNDLVFFNVVVNEATTDDASLHPFASARVTDTAASETARVTYAGANGALSGGGFAGSAGDYSVTGTPAQVQAALQALVFTPTAHQVATGQSVTTPFTITLTAGTTVHTDTTFAVTATSAAAPGGGGVVLTGGAQAATLQGTAGNDTLTAGSAGDTLVGGAGSDVLTGGAGVDTAAYAGFAHDYALALGGGSGTVAGGREGGTDTLSALEDVKFLDGVLTFDPHSTAAEVVRLYDSFLGRAPDVAGFNSYLNFVASGHSFQEMADNAAASPEFANATAGLTDTQYVTYVYEHSLHREPDAGGLQTYVADLQNGTFTRTSLIVQAAESPEHIALTASVVAHGLWIPDETVEGLELLYDAAVHRQPDATGLAGYGAMLASGTSFRQIANQMASSAEFQAAHGGQSAADYIDSLYVAEVGRHADATGLAAYTTELANGHTRGDILYETAMSQEHQSHVLAFYDPLLMGS